MKPVGQLPHLEHVMKDDSIKFHKLTPLEANLLDIELRLASARFMEQFK